MSRQFDCYDIHCRFASDLPFRPHRSHSARRRRGSAVAAMSRRIAGGLISDCASRAVLAESFEAPDADKMMPLMPLIFGAPAEGSRKML